MALQEFARLRLVTQHRVESGIRGQIAVHVRVAGQQAIRDAAGSDGSLRVHH